MDSQGLVVDWSPGAEAIFGWSSSDAIGAKLSKLIVPERFRDAHEAGLRRFATTGEGGTLLDKPITIDVINREGREFPVELFISMESMAEGMRFRTEVRRVSASE